MSKLKLSTIEDDKPVKLTIELPAAVHRDLGVYAEALAQGTGRDAVDPASSRRCWPGSWRPTAFSPSCAGPDQNSPRERASSRRKATKRPTAAS